MLPIKTYHRPTTIMTAGLLACTVALGCKKNEQARTDAAVNAGYRDTTKAAGTSTDTTLRGSQGGTVYGGTDVARTTEPADTSGIAHSPQPGARADATPERRQTRTARRSYTGTQGGNLAPRRSTGVTATADAGARREGAALSDTSGGNAVAATNNLITAEPQVFTVILLANIGDSSRAVRMCLNPAANTNDQLRSYVQQEIRDHALLNARAVQLVRQQNVIPTRSRVSDQAFQRNQDQPRADENPRDFFTREARVHQDVLTALDQQLIPTVRDSALRNLLVDGRQVVQSHLTRAQQLQTTVSAQPGAALTTPAPGAAVSADTANKENKPATVAPQYGQTSTMSVTANPPAVTVTTTPTPANCDLSASRASYQAAPPDTTRARPDTTGARPTPQRP